MNDTSNKRGLLVRHWRAAVAVVTTAGLLAFSQVMPSHSFAFGASNGGGRPGTNYNVCNVSTSTSGSNVTIRFSLWGNQPSSVNPSGQGTGCSSDTVNESSKSFVISVNGVQTAGTTPVLVIGGGQTTKFGGQTYYTTINMAGQPAGYYTLLVSDTAGIQYQIPFYYGG